MKVLASLNTHVGKLVHPAPQARSLEFIAHRNFLATRFAVSLGALVAVPLCLAFGEAPTWWETGSLAWLLLPMAAVASVSRSGNLAMGEALSLLAWIGLAVTLALGSGSATGLGLLLLVPLEALLASRPMSKSSLTMIGVAAAASILVPVATRFGTASPPDPHIVSFGAGLTAAAEAYAIVLALMAGKLHGHELRRARGAQHRYRELSEAIDDLPMRLDRSGMVLQADASAERLFGIAGGKLIGRGLFEHVHVADRPAFLKLIADVADRAGSGSVVVRLRTGTTLASQKGPFREPVFAWAELRVRMLDRTAQGDAAACLLCLMSDVTARRTGEAALEEAEQSMRRSETGRTVFLAKVSHELRTPLNAIIGFADMLASDSYAPRDPAKQKEYAGIILQSGHHLLAVVNTILDASKIESGSFTIVPEPFSLARLIHGCCDMVGLKAEDSGIDVARDIAAVMSDVVGDERAYKQILLNLLSNAIKFTSRGGTVVVSARPDGTSIILSVADTGVGIGAGDLPQLGAPFFQAQNAYDRAFEGTGLGLSVVRGLVGLHGGSMSIESAPGQGTRVAVRFPSDCRTHSKSAAGDIKIETIPRYVAPNPSRAGQIERARIHKIA